MELDNFLSGKRLEAFKAIKSALAPIWEADTADWRLPDQSERATYALSKNPDGKHIASVLIDLKDGFAHRRVRSILEEYPDSIMQNIAIGEAQSSYQSHQKFAAHAINGDLRPGVTVSHGRYRCGTLGCFISVENTGRDEKGFVSAGHVLALSQSVEEGDPVYSPGKGSIPRLTRKERIAELTDAIIELYPITDYDDNLAAEDVAIDIDVCFARLNAKGLGKTPLENFVPDPATYNHGSRLTDENCLRLQSVANEKSLVDLIDTDVYMFGAVSGLRSGRIASAYVDRKTIKLPNNRIYLYKELIAVKSLDGLSFSKSGDSGSVLYNKNCSVIGFLVGADRYLSYFCIADRALKQLKGRLL